MWPSCPLAIMPSGHHTRTSAPRIWLSPQSEHQMDRRIASNMIVVKGLVVIQLFALKHKALLVCIDPLLLVDLFLDIRDSHALFEIKDNCLARESLDEKLATRALDWPGVVKWLVGNRLVGNRLIGNLLIGLWLIDLWLIDLWLVGLWLINLWFSELDGKLVRVDHLAVHLVC